MPNIEKAKNQAGKTIFPVTVADAVLMGNGKTLKGELTELGSELNNITYEQFIIKNTYLGSYASTGTLVASSYYNCVYYRIKGGKKYLLSATAKEVGTDSFQYGFCDNIPERGTAYINGKSITTEAKEMRFEIFSEIDCYFVAAFEKTKFDGENNIILSSVGLINDVEDLKRTTEILKNNSLNITYKSGRYLENGVIKALNGYHLHYISVIKGASYAIEINSPNLLDSCIGGFLSQTPATDVQYKNEIWASCNGNKNLIIFTAEENGIFAFSYYAAKQESIAYKLSEIHSNKNYQNVYFEKTTDRVYVYVKKSEWKYIRYVLEHRTKSYTSEEYPSFYDNWGLNQPTLCYFFNNEMYISLPLFVNGSEAELAFTTQGGIGHESEVPYVGGAAHGFENISITDAKRDVVLLADGKYIEEDDVIPLHEITTFNAFQRSLIYRAYTNSNPIAHVEKNWTIDAKGVLFGVKLIADTDFDIGSGAQMGMMGVFRRPNGSKSYQYLTNKAIKTNIGYKVFDVQDGWSSSQLSNIDHDCKKIIEVGDYGIGFSMEVLDSNDSNNGGMFISTNNTVYNKMYHQFARQERMSAGKEYHSLIKWMIE